MKKLLEVCIPTYKRPLGAVNAALSVINQINKYNLDDKVFVRISEDFGGVGDYIEIVKLLDGYKNILISSNDKNLGMSRNIYNMIEACNADYCMILTDDDYISDDVLLFICNTLIQASPSIVYGPRYSYCEDGRLYTIATNTYKNTKFINNNEFNVGKHASCFFILSGLILKRSSVAFKEWKRDIDNSFFPIIFGALTFKLGQCLFLKNSLVHHTVMNKCHWESWGATSSEQQLRLANDYFDALDIIKNSYLKSIQRYCYTIGTIESRALHFLVTVNSSIRDLNIDKVRFIINYIKIFFKKFENIISISMIPYIILNRLIFSKF